jgi:hypothetical protein
MDKSKRPTIYAWQVSLARGTVAPLDAHQGTQMQRNENGYRQAAMAISYNRKGGESG